MLFAFVAARLLLASPVSPPAIGSGSTVRSFRQVTDTGGFVVDSARRPIAGASVTLLSTSASVTTGRSGRFSFRGIPPGRAQLSVRAVGYLPVIHDFDLARAAGRGDTVVLQAAPVQLRPLEVEGVLQQPTFNLAVEQNPGSEGPLVFVARGPEGISAALSGFDGLVVFVGNFGYPGTGFPGMRRFGGPPPLREPPGAPAGLDFAFNANPDSSQACPGATWSAIAAFADSSARRFTFLTDLGQIWAAIIPGERPTPCRQVQLLDLGGEALAASGDRAGWVVAVRRPDGPVVGRWRHSARLSFVARVDGLFDRTASLVAVTAVEGQTLVARRDWPFGWVELDSTGQVTHRSQGDLAAVAASRLALPQLSGWHAHQVLPIENGYIQTLEDGARSNRRYLLFDQIGRLVGMPSGGSQSPLLAAAVRGARLLVGLKWTNWRHRSYAGLLFRY